MQQPVNDDRPLPTPQASKFLGDLGFQIAPATLVTKRVRGGGPTFLKVGPRIVYRPSALREWASAHTRELTSTAQAA